MTADAHEPTGYRTYAQRIADGLSLDRPARVSDAQLERLVKHVRHGMSYRAIAREEGVATETVRAGVHVAVRRLLDAQSTREQRRATRQQTDEAVEQAQGAVLAAAREAIADPCETTFFALQDVLREWWERLERQRVHRSV